MSTSANLRSIRNVAWTGLTVLCVALVYALTTGHFAAEAALLVANPWGLATLVDVYVGFALFSCWIVWREQCKRRALVWVVLVLATGNIASTVYVLLALHESRNDVEGFWRGGRSNAGALEDG